MPSRQNFLVWMRAGEAAGPKESVKVAQHDPTAQVESSVQLTLVEVRFLKALVLTWLMQVHTLATLLTLKETPLNWRGAQTAAAVETAVPALLREAQQ